MNKGGHGAGGFTLIEVTVGAGIFAVIMVLCVYLLAGMNEAIRESRALASLDAEADAAFDVLRTDLQALPHPGYVEEGFESERSEASADALFWRIPLEDDRLGFPIYQTDEASGLESIVRVRYYVERDGGLGALIREVYVPGEPPDEDAAETIARGVVGFRLMFMDDGGEWRDGWEAPEPPRAVRAALTVADIGAPERQAARERVFALSNAPGAAL